MEDRRGETALKYATLEGHTDIVEVLLEKGANVDVKDMNGETSLMHVARQGNGEIVQTLLDEGADVDTKEQA